MVTYTGHPAQACKHRKLCGLQAHTEDPFSLVKDKSYHGGW